MTTVSIRLPDELLKEADKHAHEMHIPRAEYIRRAIVSLNAEAIASHRRRRMMEASRRVRAGSSGIQNKKAALRMAATSWKFPTRTIGNC